jgi:GT2 family glycosyltransferase
MNKVYIVLVNYNNYADTIECLESLLKSSYLNFQIFIVDNSLNDTSTENLSSWMANNDYNISTDFKDLIFPLEHKPVSHDVVNEVEFNTGNKTFEKKITIIRAKNNGFAAANNIVLKYIMENGAEASLIWILNNDTVVEKNTLYNLVDFYQHNINNKYILGSKLMHYNRPNVIQAVAGNYNAWIGKHTHVGNGEEDFGQYDDYKPGEMDYPVGASVFLSKLFIEQAGLMCEDYFLYFEELDWVKTGNQYGFTMALVPDAVVYHKEGASIIGEDTIKKKDTSLAEYYSITNRVKFIKKWYPYCLLTVMMGVIAALIKRTFKGKFRLVGKTSITIFKILFTKNYSSLKNAQ